MKPLSRLTLPALVGRRSRGQRGFALACLFSIGFHVALGVLAWIIERK
jgi:hypothetical protein